MTSPQNNIRGNSVQLASPAVKPLIVIPVFNHGKTLRRVAESCLQYGEVLIVDDGSTDGGTETVQDLALTIVSHGKNIGKGQAILTAAQKALELGKTHIITIDADGQHFPEDIPAFLEAIKKAPETLFVGSRNFSGQNIPASSKFGRSFSNFWLRVQTGEKLGDVQSGFRAYPLEIFPVLKTSEKRYAFEVEILVKAAWAGYKLKDIPIEVFYPTADKRISHFKALKDNVQISLLNTRLTARSFIPVPHRQFDKDEDGKITPIHPLRSMRILLSKDETPLNLAVSGAIGMLLGTLPLIAMHSIAIIVVCGFFRLSKITGLAVSQLCIPPLVPALCIEAGHFMRHNEFLTEISLQTLGYEALQRFYEWVLGSLVLGPVFALITGLTIYIMAFIVKRFLDIKPL
ncbi:DUF2062 domain-containing protein [Maridesulfovibrio hydrothermalis]|uniref:Glycosyl transferase family 2 n=1 Tax=Maridesulfovibrio hydrothermalis AM13 = DSM 14728 TaxID=1121451 RepID=L0RB37_9BACT|nr:DUF2062 domain-containing protein [Maridesulfovibrio hydrothermalis]CCO23422.1 Glycosyl transferase family 2 [Maridesulfovibrio hydrothermalis AM13 = DSM 14728]